MINSSKDLRQLNKEQLLDSLKLVASATKNSLAKSTGLSVATCGNILNDCLKTEEVFEIELGQSTGGRPSRQFIFNKDYCYTASLYPRHEGKTISISVSINNLLGDVIYHHHIECDVDILVEIDDILTNILEKYPKIKTLSFGVPGVVHHGIIGICDIAEFIDFNFKAYFEKKYKLPVTVDNDVNLSAYGYYHKNLSNSKDSLAYIYFPLDGNPGSGIIIHGEIVYGFSNFAGEVSYMPGIISRHVQGNIQQSPKEFATYVATIIMNINCVINPKTIVLSGYCFSDLILHEINNNLVRFSRVNYVPTIVFEEDLHDSYMYGLVSKSLSLVKEDNS